MEGICGPLLHLFGMSDWLRPRWGVPPIWSAVSSVTCCWGYKSDLDIASGVMPWMRSR